MAENLVEKAAALEATTSSEILTVATKIEGRIVSITRNRGVNLLVSFELSEHPGSDEIRAAIRAVESYLLSLES